MKKGRVGEKKRSLREKESGSVGERPKQTDVKTDRDMRMSESKATQIIFSISVR